MILQVLSMVSRLIGNSKLQFVPTFIFLIDIYICCAYSGCNIDKSNIQKQKKTETPGLFCDQFTVLQWYTT